MFDLEKEIDNWCEKLNSSGDLTKADIDELKDHLYCEIEGQQKNNLSIDQAFAAAKKTLGNTTELGRAYSISRSKSGQAFQLIGGYRMSPSKVTFDLYLVCTILFGWILFTWVTRLVENIESNIGLASIFISIIYVAAVGSALVASAARKPLILLVTSVICFILLGAFMLGTEYWWFWTQLNTGASLLCVIFSIYIQKQQSDEVGQIDG